MNYGPIEIGNGEMKSVSLPEEHRDGGTVDPLAHFEPYGWFHPVTGELIRFRPKQEPGLTSL